MGLHVHRPSDDGGYCALDVIVVQVGAFVGLQVQGVTVPVVEDVAGHLALWLDDDAALVALDDLAEVEGDLMGSWQLAQLLAVHLHHALQVVDFQAQRGTHEEMPVGMISEPHRGHAPAQFHINLSEFLILDVTLHNR